MAQAIATQNQNVQLTKTFIAAFVGMLLAVPIVTLITASIVQAQFGSLVHAAAQTPQTNSIVAGPSCEVPVSEQVSDAATDGASKNWLGKTTKWPPFIAQTNYNSTSTSTTTSTSAVTIRDNGNTDNRWSGNTLGLTLTDNRWSGNTTNTDLSNRSVNTTIQDSGNTSNTSTNTTTSTTTNTDNTNNSVNDSANTTNTDNSDNSVNDSANTDVDVDVDVDAGLF